MNSPVCQVLNEAYNSELKAIIQYSTHATVLEVWGYDKLACTLSAAAREEMQHSHMLVERLVQLGDAPVVTSIEPKQGDNVQGMLDYDHDAEAQAVDDYNRFIAVATEHGDNETRALFEEILRQETKHKTYLEAQLQQIEDMGIQNYLAAIL